tara:strand:- start:1044 stop:1475 length:432 start_codon:yes stop_codon:yes gene_type:complete
MSRITLDELDQLTREKLPFAVACGIKAERLDSGSVTVRAIYQSQFLRPGGTLSGPLMMALADYAMYAAILTRLGLVEMAVTSSLNINFLAKAIPGDLIADAELIKLGKRLVVGSVDIHVAGESNQVAHATCTYSIPSRSVDSV